VELFKKSLQYSSRIYNARKTLRGRFGLCSDWLRASTSRYPNPVRQKSGSVQTITLVACQVGLSFCLDCQILRRPFESVGPSRFWSMSSSATQTRTLTPFLGQ